VAPLAKPYGDLRMNWVNQRKMTWIAMKTIAKQPHPKIIIVSLFNNSVTLKLIDTA